jgi:hypothetical protein
MGFASLCPSYLLVYEQQSFEKGSPDLSDWRDHPRAIND